MHGVGIIGWIVIGLLAGWVASMAMNRQHGLIVNLVVGLVGAFIGGALNRHFLHLNRYFNLAHHVYIADFVIAFIGAVILLAILGLFNRPRL